MNNTYIIPRNVYYKYRLFTAFQLLKNSRKNQKKYQTAISIMKRQLYTIGKRLNVDVSEELSLLDRLSNQYDKNTYFQLMKRIERLIKTIDKE